MKWDPGYGALGHFPQVLTAGPPKIKSLGLRQFSAEMPPARRAGGPRCLFERGQFSLTWGFFFLLSFGFLIHSGSIEVSDAVREIRKKRPIMNKFHEARRVSPAELWTALGTGRSMVPAGLGSRVASTVFSKSNGPNSTQGDRCRTDPELKRNHFLKRRFSAAVWKLNHPDSGRWVSSYPRRFQHSPDKNLKPHCAERGIFFFSFWTRQTGPSPPTPLTSMWIAKPPGIQGNSSEHFPDVFSPWRHPD